MMDQLIALIVDESKWLTVSMGLAFLAVFLLLYRHRNAELLLKPRVLAGMNLFFGVTIGTMAFGHLLAVTTKLIMGTLEGPTFLFYVIGIALAVPSWWIILNSRKVLESKNERKTLALNTWLAVTLLAFGIHNLPLAAPAFLNIGYQLHARRMVGWAIVSVAVVVQVGLFIGSVVFLLSGQSFEQFSEM